MPLGPSNQPLVGGAVARAVAETLEYATAFRAGVAAIQNAEHLALACHVTPDGDALGSVLAFHLAARNAGVQSVASWPAPFQFAPHYRSVPGVELAINPADFPSHPDIMVTFDCGSMGRLNELGDSGRRAKELVVVDHHASNQRYGTINVVDPTAASTTVVVHKMLGALGWPITRDIAWCLYVGLVTDTGRFQYEATTPATFALAEELTSFDLPIARINRELFDEHRFTYLQLAARVLGRAELDLERSLVMSCVSQVDLAEFGVDYDEVEGLIDWLRTSAEAEITVLVKEAADGVRVSMRGKESADVGAIAALFGGGGHRLASGFSSNASVSAVIAEIKAAIPAAIPVSSFDESDPLLH
jgi:bifunctional oligoribonuclease and PAP phosphatase NrnA